MGKYLKQGFVRKLEWQLAREEISHSKMVELMEEECIKNYIAEMTQEELADKILARYEDDREYHFHQVDREWIIEAMIEFANKVNTREK